MPLVAAAVVPSAPLLLPEVTGPGADDLRPLREAVASAVDHVLAAALPAKARVMVAARAEPGHLAGTGAPVVVPAPGSDAGWAHELGRALLRSAGWSGDVEDVVLPDGPPPDSPPDSPPESLLDEAAVLDARDPVALLVLADGSATRGPRAPGGEDPRGDDLDAAIAEDLAVGRVPAVDDDLARALRVRGLPGFGLAVRAAGAAGLAWTVTWTGAPAGVGYLVAVTTPGAPSRRR